MTALKATKRALFSSVLALILCFAMLLGTTFAWFTDSAVSANNKVQAGTLDVELWQHTENGSQNISTSNAPLFTGDTQWEPGRTEVVYLSIKNNGSLDLKYKVAIETKSVSDHDLREVMSYAITPDAQYGEVTAWPADQAARLDTDSMTTVATADVSLAAEQEHLFALSIHMDEEAGNVYMNDSIVFDIKVLAGQLASEEDGYGNPNYDADASYFENASDKVLLPDDSTANQTLTSKGENAITAVLTPNTLNGLPDSVTSIALAHSAPKVDETAKTIVIESMEIVDQNDIAIDLSANQEPVTVSFPVPFDDGMVFDIYHDNTFVAAAIVTNGMITYQALHFCEVKLVESVPVNVSTESGLLNAFPGQTLNLVADIDLSEEITLPAGITLVGNGKQINGTVYAGGDLTIEGHVKVTSFSASYYNRTITISEGACFEVTGTGRVTLGYGNTFNIYGTLDNAKAADKANVQPSLIIPGGMSITGGSDATMNVTNAYVKIGSTTSKNSAANGTFTLNFTNSIAEFTNQLTLAEPTSGKNPTFNINVTDSVLTTGTKLIVAAPNSTVVVDNSVVTLGTYFRNSGDMTIQNGSVFTGATIQFGENGGNNGTTTVDNATFTIQASSTGHALDGKGTGKLVFQNGAVASVDYYTNLDIVCDETSTFTTKVAQ